MGPLIFAALVLLLGIPLVLGIITPIIQNHDKATGNVVNYDSMMRVFLYRVHMTEEEIINTLQVKNDVDELSCEFDFDNAIVKISEYGSSREYYYSIQAGNGFSILKLTQVSSIGIRSNLPYKLNPFMVKKLNAELVPYNE